MPSILNSDDGVVSGTSGLKSTGGNDGITAFQQNGTERMRIDSSGNVGIGVTPSAWGTNKALQVERGGITSYISAQTDLFQNCYYDGSNWKYIATDEANKLTMLNGQFIMYSAPSGTAGNNITFTEVFQVNKDKTIALQGATQQTGTGITFPATQSASSNANTLDDYEEGTWTPSIFSGWSSVTYVTQSGEYTKIGNQVTAWFYVQFSGTSAAANIALTGLPFNANGNTRGGAITYFTAPTNATTGVITYPSGAQVQIIVNDDTGLYAQSNGNASNSYFIGSVTYTV